MNHQISAIPSSFTVEDGLDYLAKYGKPRVSKMREGWYCVVEMVVTLEGVQFEIKSSFDEPTARQAVQTCCDRLKTVLKGLGK